jgi:molecular chaperone GrpE
MNDEDATGPSASEDSDAARDASGSEVNGGDQSQADQSGGAESDSPGAAEESATDTVEWVAETDPEEVAGKLQALQREAETLEAERERLEAEVESLEERVQRVQADFQNYKKRMERRREEEQARATQDLVERLLPVRDNLSRALSQDDDSDIRDGVEATLTALDDVFETEGVEVIEPSVGDSVEPTRHEVVHREDQEGEAVASIYRKGYEMEGHVLRPAQVTVGSADATEEGAEPAEQPSEREADQ